MICLRCNKELGNPPIEVNFPTGNREIACTEWCPACNAFIMSILFRDGSVYRPLQRVGLHPPKINIAKEVIDAMSNPKSNSCACGKKAWVWNGEKAVCWECNEREVDYRRGYSFDTSGYRTVSLEDKYGKEDRL